jgi:hypothetical protein
VLKTVLLQTVDNLEWHKGLPAVQSSNERRNLAAKKCFAPFILTSVTVVVSTVPLQTVGNHEWDKGLPALQQYLDKQHNKAVLGANIDFKGHQLQSKIKPYVIKMVKGKKVSSAAY